ncbi:PAP2 superfamily protein [uncultured archaeon]|nr:PAP2 superfamily protein [uncultured archaeon]
MVADIISRTLFNLDVPALTAISSFLDMATWPFLLLAWLYVVLSKDPGLASLRKKADVAFIAALLLLAALQYTKTTVDTPRPCETADAVGKGDCPGDGSFPSGHTAIAALFTAFALGTPLFIPSLAFYGMVAFSRVYLGFHYLNDVLAGTAFGLMSYFLIWSLVRPRERLPSNKGGFFLREIAHVGFGLSVMLLVAVALHFVASWGIMSAALITSALLCFLLVMDMRWSGRKIPLIGRLFGKIGIRDTFPGEGAFWFLAGSLLLLTMVTDSSKVMTSIFIVTVGDIASAMFSSSRTERSIFKNKTPASFAAFVISTLPATFIAGWGVFPLLLAAAAIESLDLKVNDNFLMLLLCTVFFA